MPKVTLNYCTIVDVMQVEPKKGDNQKKNRKVILHVDEEDFFDRRACDQRFFALTDREDDMSAEFNALIKKIEAPIKNKFQKIFSQNVGIFEFSSFGGKYNKIIKRTSVE